jgi:serine/threonine protein kinase
MKTFKAKKRHMFRFRTRTHYKKLNAQSKRHKLSNDRKKYGGSIIGQGNFGCVFRPDIINGNKDIVSKIVLKTNIFNEYRHEYKILNKLSSIDDTGKFHSLMTTAIELTPNIIPPDFNKCSLSRPNYNVKDFFVFNMKFCGTNNLTHYLHRAFSKTASSTMHIEPSILFTLLTNVIVGIKKMVKVNVVHKTLDTDSIYLSEPVSLRNPYCEKIIDFGEGDVRKYDTFSDKYQDYSILFNSIIKILDVVHRSDHHNRNYTQIILDLRNMFNELLRMVNMPKFAQDELIKKYITSIGVIFGASYSKYASNKYR